MRPTREETGLVVFWIAALYKHIILLGTFRGNLTMAVRRRMASRKAPVRGLESSPHLPLLLRSFLAHACPWNPPRQLFGIYHQPSACASLGLVSVSTAIAGSRRSRRREPANARQHQSASDSESQPKREPRRACLTMLPITG